MIDQTNFYEEKQKNYFSASRTDILPLIPDKVEKVLEIGCGEGSTLVWIKTIRNCKLIVGVELFPEAALTAQDRVDMIIQGNIESITLPFNPNEFDLIICLDILEHLVDPWTVVEELTNFLKSGGSLISSIPNIKHYSVIMPLLLKGQFDYTNKGVLDKTHLRFFTRKTAIDLIESGGMIVEKVISTGREKKSKARIANILSLGIFKVFFEKQYLIRAIKN